MTTRASTAGGGAAADVISRIRSERDFAQEMQRIGQVLADKDNWDRRLEALTQLRGVLEYDVSRFDACQAILAQFIKVPLQSQVSDLRSSIVKEACACVRAMANSAGSGVAETFSEWNVKELLSACCNTTAVIAHSADEALRVIAASGRVNRAALLGFFNGCSSKHSVVRRNAFHYLLLLLSSIEPTTVQRHIGTIEKMLKAGTSDALPDARKYARMGVWALNRTSPKHAGQLIHSLESAVQRAVENERGEYENWVAAGDLVPTSDGKSPSSQGKKGGAQKQQPSTARGVPALAPSSARPPRGSTDASTLASRNAPATARNAPAASQRSTSAPGTEQSATAPSATARTVGRRSGTGAATPGSAGARGGREAEKEPEGAPSDDAWYAALDGAHSSDWLTRMRSFDTITEFVTTGTLSIIRAGDCVPLVVKHLSDTHFRVVMSVMTTCDVMVEKVPDVVAPALERLLTPLFLRLTDAKKQIAEKARSSLDALRRVYGVDTLVPVLHKVLDVNNSKVRVAAVEFLTYLLGFASKYFSVAPALRATLMRALAIASRRPAPDVQRAVLTFIAKLYERHRDLFVAQINALNSTEQHDTIELLKKPIPHLQQDCKRQLAGEQLLRHPPTTTMGDDFDDSPARGSGGGPNDAGSSGARRSGTRRAYGDHRDAADAALNPRPKHVDPSAFGATALADRHTAQMVNSWQDGGDASTPSRGVDADRHDSTVVISTSPVAQWRAERNMPREIAALKSATTAEERRSALQTVHRALSEHIPLWRDYFVRVIAFPLSFTADGSDHVLRQNALQTLRAVLVIAPLQDQVAGQQEAILRAAVSCLDDAYPEVQAEAVTCYRETSAVFDPAAVLEYQQRIVEALLPMNARCLEFVLRELVAPFRRCVEQRRSVPRSLVAKLPSLIEVLTMAFSHHSSDIRKTAVLDFVDLYLALGDEALPRMTELSHAQLKLISIYVMRTMGSGEQVDLMSRMLELGILTQRP